VELLDGFSNDYGASLTDLGANSLGALLAYSQYSIWEEPRLHLKYSFHRSGLAKQRPEMLGKNMMEEVLKDYNGQTFWLSIDIEKFLSNENKFPKWLNIGLGYSVQDIIYARDRTNPYRQFFLSLDLDLSNLKTNSKLVRSLLYGVNMIHLPAPAMEFSQNRMKFHWLYF
jgi:hypothetical protein